MEYTDPLYGPQLFPAVVRDIINTSHFRRLLKVKQLGACNFVFDGAEHTRYEHCLGVCAQVIRYLDILKTNSPDIQTDEFYELCVILAGLLHDIGHGPYSHMWEHFVQGGTDKHWTHENTSCDVVEHLFQANNICLSDDPALHSTGVRLIVALIRCDDSDQHTIAATLGDELNYLSEIVNNKYCLIDVDKLDYMLRDVHYLRVPTVKDQLRPVRRIAADGIETIENAGLRHNMLEADFFSFEACFVRARVLRCTGDDRTHIAFHEHTFGGVQQLFANRSRLHRDYYQHLDVVGIEVLLRHIFQFAEESGYLFDGCKLTECQQDMRVYQKLDDLVLNAIENSNDNRLHVAQRFIEILRKHEYSVELDKVSQIVKVIVSNNNDEDSKALYYQLHLPDGSCLPSTLMLFGDDGWTAEINPNVFKPRC